MKIKKELPFVSIVVCAYNAENKIEQTIKSLLNQTYPKSNYEIIVVDDCSKDKTVEIVKGFPVKLIQHKKNKGLSGARNTGLKYSKGEIYVGFDDDCIADKNWLKELIKVYLTREDVAGVAGLIVDKPISNLTEKFIQEAGCGNPSPDYIGGKKNIFFRFFLYVKSKVYPINNLSSRHIFKIGMMSGANSSFKKKILIDVCGWDENLSGVEDTDLIYRIKEKNKQYKLYVNTKANLIHDHKMNFKYYILRAWKRRKAIAKQFSNKKKIIVLFPFPILFLLALLISVFIDWKLFILFIIILPQLLYFWFPLKFIKTFRIRYIIFPYMLLIDEIVSLVSIFIGFFEVNKHGKI